MAVRARAPGLDNTPSGCALGRGLRSGATAQLPPRFLRSEPMQFDQFMPRCPTANQFDPVASAIQNAGEQTDERLVGGRIHRGGGDSDAQLAAQGFADFIGRRARLEFH